MSDLVSLYETDYAAWAKRHVDLLRAGRFSEIDVEHLSQELSDMGKSERRELESRLLILIAHVLKWEHQDFALSGPRQQGDAPATRNLSSALPLLGRAVTGR